MSFTSRHSRVQSESVGGMTLSETHKAAHAETPPCDMSETVVVHRAALGDFCLIWPLLRRLAPCTIVTDAGKGRIAQRLLADVRSLPIETPFWNGLWTDRAPVSVHESVRHLICYVADSDSIWARSARCAFPNAQITYQSARPARPREDRALWPDRQSNHCGPLVLHIGAGSPNKRWPIQRSLALSALLPGKTLVLAGEVEEQGLDRRDREQLLNAGARFLRSLDELVDVLQEAQLYIGFDTGPTHLAAQMGLRTIALFGPTDAHQWAPIGPQVTLIAPRAEHPMTWLHPARVLETIRALPRERPVKA